MNNIATVTGRLVANPELKTFNNDKVLTRFTIACSRDYKQMDGTRETDFLDCVLFGKPSSFFVEIVKKGDLVQVQGRLQTSSYTDKNGVSRKRTEINCSHWYLLGAATKSAMTESPEDQSEPTQDFSLDDLDL